MYNTSGVRALVEDARLLLRGAGVPDSLRWHCVFILGREFVLNVARGDPGIATLEARRIRAYLKLEAVGEAWLRTKDLAKREALTAALHALDERITHRAFVSSTMKDLAKRSRPRPLRELLKEIEAESPGIPAKLAYRRLDDLQKEPGYECKRPGMAYCGPALNLLSRRARRIASRLAASAARPV